MAEKRKRGHNFSTDEKNKLIKLLRSHNVILNKKMDGPTNQAKNYAWILLTSQYNSTGNNYRTKESLIKQWEKLKSEAKLYDSSIKNKAPGAEGGPTTVQTDPILSQVCTILERGYAGNKDVNDSNGADFSESPENYPDPLFLLQIEEIEQQEENDIIEDTIPRTDSTLTIEHKRQQANIRRPQLRSRYERSAFCSSIREINKKKSEIDNLKKTLLQEELEFKRKLYHFQLKVAAKELEIKNEMLSQLKGGRLSLHNLLEGPKKD